MNVEIVVRIVVIVVSAIGAASVLAWVFKKMKDIFKPYEAGTLLQVCRDREDAWTKWEDLPHYKGRTWFCGLPYYRDVIVPNKHNYATVVYMDHPVKQWAYDWMASWKAVANDKENPYGVFALLCFLALPFLFNKLFGILFLVAAVLLFIFGAPSGKRAVRRMAERSRNLTPDDWRKIYKEVAESIEREDEMARAFRKSGAGWGRW